MTTTAILVRILPLTMVAGVIVALVSIAGAPSWAVGICACVLGIGHSLVTWRIVNPRPR